MVQLLAYQVSVADGHRWRDFVANSEERWLTQLAHWVTATNGPIAHLDFTIESLVPLWTWYVDWYRAGLPGVSDHVRNETGYAFRAETPQDADDWQEERRDWSADGLSHYSAATIRRYDPTARYEVKPIVPGSREEFAENDTIFVAFDKWVLNGFAIRGAVYNIDNRTRATADPQRIRENIVATYPMILDRVPAESSYDLRELSNNPIRTVKVPRFRKAWSSRA